MDTSAPASLTTPPPPPPPLLPPLPSTGSVNLGACVPAAAAAAAAAAPADCVDAAARSSQDKDDGRSASPASVRAPAADHHHDVDTEHSVCAPAARPRLRSPNKVYPLPSPACEAASSAAPITDARPAHHTANDAGSVLGTSSAIPDMSVPGSQLDAAQGRTSNATAVYTATRTGSGRISPTRARGSPSARSQSGRSVLMELPSGAFQAMTDSPRSTMSINRLSAPPPDLHLPPSSSSATAKLTAADAAGGSSPNDAAAARTASLSCWARCLRRNTGPEPNRVAAIHKPEDNGYGDNFITTSKYTWISFIPRSLFEQFRRIANVYFFGISIVMFIGTYFPKVFESPLSPYSTLGPLCLVLAITMLKEGIEDFKRHRSDHEVNNRMASVVHVDGSIKQVPWKDIRVGMVLKLPNRSEVPADIMVLQTSEPRAACYVETSNIDGETNLKLREGVGPISYLISSDAEAARLRGTMEYEPPNDRIHTFTGRISVQTDAHLPVGARNVVLRDCMLRNTKWVMGLVLYTGRDTKVMKKSGGVRSKMSQVEKTVNMCIRIIFAAQFVLCTLTTIALVLWNVQHTDEYPYLYIKEDELILPSWLGSWLTFLVLFNNFIPISLYVTVEMVNFAQARLIDMDREMYDPDSNTPAKARTSNLNQDLGQIEYVFSDKTGTLTRNVMEFKQCSVGGRVFGVFKQEADEDELTRISAVNAHEHAQRAKATGPCEVWYNCGCRRTRRTAPPHERASPMLRAAPAATTAATAAGGVPVISAPNPMQAALSASVTPSAGASAKPPPFTDPTLMAALRGASAPGRTSGYGAEWTPQTYSTAVANNASNGLEPVATPLSTEELVCAEAFFMCMAVCHTVVPEFSDEDPSLPPVFQAESPDEGALANAARDLGFEFIERNSDHIFVKRVASADGRDAPRLRYNILGVHEFNSTRKRMSVITQAPDGRFFLMVKGADNVIFERAHTEAGRAALEAHLTHFASAGLRTLVLAQRELSEAEFAAWRQEYSAASVVLTKREEALAAVAEKFERELHVLGATAIEDRLQDGVPGTIRDLARAGIKTWVLTGDKVETAINIGFSCRLLDDSMELIQLVAEDEATVRKQLQSLHERFQPLLDNPRSILRRLFRGGRSHSPGSARTASASGGANRSDSVNGSPQSVAELRLQTNMAVIVTGIALTHILRHPDSEKSFLAVAQCCRAVVACRVSPQQKADLVRLVRKGISPSPMTLAIGDGANDVGMIQRAEVGIGISGKEGLQAVNSADFAIAQFRFLRRLLLVHGRWDYRRMTKVVLYSFYKNVVITLCLFYYTAITGFSGTSLYESLVYSTYNFVLGLPIIFVGILDRDISAETALDHPAVYAVGRRYEDLNLRKIMSWIAWAVLHSFIVFWAVYGAMGTLETTWYGGDSQVVGLAVFGLTQFNVLVAGMQFEVSMQTSSWTWLNYFMIILSMAAFYLFLLIYSYMLNFAPDFYGVTVAAWSSPDYWLCILLALGAMFVLDFSTELCRRLHFPTATDIAVELDRGYGQRSKSGAVHWGDEDAPMSPPVPATPSTPASPSARASMGAPLAPTLLTTRTGVLTSAAGTGAAGVYAGAAAGGGGGGAAAAARMGSSESSSGLYVNVPNEVVMSGVDAHTKVRVMGVHAAGKRSGYDFSYPTGKPGDVRSPSAKFVDSDA